METCARWRARKIHAHGLHVTQAAIREADVLADFFRDFEVGRIQVDVVCHQEFARADDGRPGGGMQPGFADVWRAIGILGDFGEQAFELAFANIFQVAAFGALRGGFVEINGNAIALPNFAADFFRKRDAVFDADAFDGNKWHHVGRAHARMRAGMLGEVNQFGSFARRRAAPLPPRLQARPQCVTTLRLWSASLSRSSR